VLSLVLSQSLTFAPAAAMFVPGASIWNSEPRLLAQPHAVTCAENAREMHVPQRTPETDARCNCVVSRTRDILVACPTVAPNQSRWPSRVLDALLVERRFVSGPR
jgi:hypothetical protein